MNARRPLATGLLVIAASAFANPYSSVSTLPGPGGSALASSRLARSPSSDLRDLIKASIEGGEAALARLSPIERSELDHLYLPHDYAPAWLDASGRPTRNLNDAIALLNASADDALEPADYYQDVLSRLVPAVEARSAVPQDLARVDVLISAGMLRYLRDVHIGRIDPRSIGFRLDTLRDEHDFGELLRAALAEQRVTNLAADLRPPLTQYRLLQSRLRGYRLLASDRTLVAPRLVSRSVHSGEYYADLDILRHELVAFGDLPDQPAGTLTAGRYEGAIVEGVRRFQVRHGIEPDGILGKHTAAALRVPAAWRVRQIELALERLRWLPHLSYAPSIVLNIPMFRLWAFETMPPDGTSQFGMDVIVGRAVGTQTPIFFGEMREVIFRPYWNVPQSILRREVLPRIEQDPDYLDREDMEIVRGSGDDAKHVDLTPGALAELNRSVLRVRQRPGPKNALGLIKFVFPNRDDVYMHGTPAQALFAKNRRDFSHGCVRVEDPVALAEWVLRDQPEWSRDRIEAATMGTETIAVKVSRPVQVVLYYTTAAVMPEDGAIHFAEDIYRHDARLDRVLAARARGR